MTSDLSARQLEIVELLAQPGLTLGQVAKVLCISPRTLGNHIINIANKLGLEHSGRFPVVLAAMQLGLVAGPHPHAFRIMRECTVCGLREPLTVPREAAA